MSQLETGVKETGKFFGALLVLVVLVGFFVACLSMAFHGLGQLAAEIDQNGGLKHIVERVWNGDPR